MVDGCTAVVTLIKPRDTRNQFPDEQFHVLPCYGLDMTDEFDSAPGQLAKVRDGAIQVLARFVQRKRLRSSPLIAIKKRTRIKKFNSGEIVDQKLVENIKKKLFGSLPHDNGTTFSDRNYCQSAFSSSTKPVLKHSANSDETIYEIESDNEEILQDASGVALALTHGSILFECAKHEVHATTALPNPNRYSPTRVSLVYYQHKNLFKADHGRGECEMRMRARRERHFD